MTNSVDNTNFTVKKKFGQNFLRDQEILNKIIEAMPKNNHHIVEIGPGLGDLTKQLIRYKKVTAYEIDRDLYTILGKKFQIQCSEQKLSIVLGDVLDCWHNGSLHNLGKYDLIANLPYNVATKIILKAFEDENCENMVVMIQKEVAEKFIAKVQEKNFLSLGVITTLLSKRSKIIAIVPPESFSPPPKVDSAILFIEKNMDVVLNDNFKKFLKIAFSQPRKKFINNISFRYNKTMIVNILNELEINLNIRPHEISANLYDLIYKRIIKYE